MQNTWPRNGEGRTGRLAAAAQRKIDTRRNPSAPPSLTPSIRLQKIRFLEASGFGARLRDELLDGEIFYSLKEARIVIESWRRHYNTVRPHESLGYKPPAPEVFVPAIVARAAPQPRPAAPPALVPRPSMN